MMQTEVPTKHAAYVHDSAIDPTATYMATCSSDRSVKLFSRNKGKGLDRGDWTEVSSASEHHGSVQKLAWAHPSFGPYLASASVDRYVCYYKVENNALVRLHKQPLPNGKDAIPDISFCPRQFGLLLGVACNDGHVRIFEAQHSRLSCKFLGNPTAAEGRDSRAAVDGVQAIAWCDSITETLMVLAVGTMSGYFCIHAIDPSSRKPVRVTMVNSVEPNSPLTFLKHSCAITSVAWAPAIGRRHQLLAFCSGAKVTVLTLRKVANAASEGGAAFPSSPTTPSTSASDAQLLYEMEVTNFTADELQLKPTRIAWNRTATLLTIIGVDKEQRMLKYVPDGPRSCSWEIISE